ncbi:MexH family multidrug efflux RND transporter periplasmic adaptor subunit [Cellvibrio zantedeschiae]|uniref:MexH family multidrug efflux RND transporter periplasmic adaptor subunit n=1 Tax=Cellvibrio zantedeschiae TaxID=1237077 RepID=A0ABQ3ASS1_9GAMM|nr:efflux RND transporter periplasmic adaptor subunit [Cellvibrio zantedeschiae]GGY66690.1 MexH family multidrug efflux RND transporter periplasmic adaptor subunit [Cellvibrio zantedeschiae]
MPLPSPVRLLTCALFLVSFHAFAQKSDKPETPLDVIVQSVAPRELQNNIEALGNLRAYESIVITAKATKTVTQIRFDDGQRVSKGATLVEMTNAEESALMEEARLTAEEAKKQLERTQSLAKNGAVSPSLLDQRTREYAAAHARFNALQARFKDLIITAPFNGVVGIRDISLGSLIAPGQVITTLNDDSKMKLDFTVPAIYLRSLRIGLPIDAQSHDLGDKTFKGKIFSIDNQVDETTRSIKVRAIFDNPGFELKQGLLMTVVIRADIRKSLVLSEAALVPMGSNNFVFVLQPNKDGKNAQWIAEKRQIYIGQRYKGLVEIVGGLQEGEKVVTHGLQKIHAGQGLNIMAEQSNDPAKKPEPLSELLKQKKPEGK